MEYMAKQDINPPPKNINRGTEIELSAAVSNTYRHRKHGITGGLNTPRVSSRNTVRNMASYSQWERLECAGITRSLNHSFPH